MNVAEAAAEAAKNDGDPLGRQTWDKEVFARKAAARQRYADEMESSGLKLEEGERKRSRVVPPPVERKPLEQRVEPLPLDIELGKSRVVTALTPKQHQGGFWCEVCDCLIKDSQTYLDHINGKKHNRQLGMTMRVEKVHADKVKLKLQQARLRSLKQQEMKQLEPLGGIELRLAEAEEKEKQKKKEKKEKKREKKKNKNKNSDDEPFVNPFEIVPGWDKLPEDMLPPK